MEMVMDKVGPAEVTLNTGPTVTSWTLKSVTEPAPLRRPPLQPARPIITTTSVATATISKICSTVRRRRKRAVGPPWWCQHAITTTTTSSQAEIQARASACTRPCPLSRLSNCFCQAQWKCKWVGRPPSPSTNNTGPTPTAATNKTTNEAFVWEEREWKYEKFEFKNEMVPWFCLTLAEVRGPASAIGNNNQVLSIYTHTTHTPIYSVMPSERG